MWYNGTMRKIPETMKIGFWLGLFLTILFILFNSYVRSVNATLAPRPSKILLVGDSYSYLAPWAVERISYPGTSVAVIAKSISGRPTDYAVTDIVILAGVASTGLNESPDKIASDLDVLEQVLHQKYPSATIHPIPLSEMLQLRITHLQPFVPGDTWHISPEGYEVIRKKHLSMLSL